MDGTAPTTLHVFCAAGVLKQILYKVSGAMPSNMQTVRINPGSDGDSRRWPTGANLNAMKQDAGSWLETLAKMWMDDRGDAMPGMLHLAVKGTATDLRKV